MKILAVDDEQDALEVLISAIQTCLPDDTIKGFNSPKEALEFAEQHPPDLAFLDIRMPGMSGLELAKRLKKANPKVNVIFSTGFSEYATDAFSLHASGYLMKPISSKDVKKELDNLRNPVTAPKKRVYIRTFGNFELYSSLKEGKYPNYEQVIPKDNPHVLTIGRDEFLKSIRRLGIYSSQSTFQVRLSLGETGLNMTAEDMDFSYKGAENIQCEYNGEPMEIGFNSRFLREMVENLDVETIQMSFSKPSRAALISPTVQHDENEDVLMLIMPVMLNY